MNLTRQEQKWVPFYVDLARDYSEFSKDPRTKVGCIIVDSNFTKVLSIGYNGWEAGGPDVPDSNVPGESGTVHSEINCLIRFSDFYYHNCYMFCTHNPCEICARAIVNFGKVSTVVYEQDYRIQRGIHILQNSGIKVIKYNSRVKKIFKSVRSV